MPHELLRLLGVFAVILWAYWLVIGVEVAFEHRYDGGFKTDSLVAWVWLVTGPIPAIVFIATILISVAFAGHT